jgi:L,D-transpeptidase catalytic domain
MSTVLLKVLLPKDRDKSGTLTVQIDGLDVRTFEVLGRGSRGPGDTQFQRDGNTPTGVYRGSVWESTENKGVHSYGAGGRLGLQPIEGKARMAAEIFGRDGLFIHGGDPGDGKYWRGASSLRATHGCLRLRNHDVQVLYHLIAGASSDEQLKMSIAPRVFVNVQEGAFFDAGNVGRNMCSADPYKFQLEGGAIKFTK